MPSATKDQAQRLEQERCRAIAQNMFNEEDVKPRKIHQPTGKIILSEMVGQLDFWNEDKEFGFIQTFDKEAKAERFYCNGPGFSAPCAVKDIVRFDVWEKNDKSSRKAVNVMKKPCIVSQHKSIVLAQKNSLVEPKKQSIVEPKKQSIVEPKKQSIVEPKKQSIVEPKKSNMESHSTWSQKEWDQWYSQWSQKEWDQWRSVKDCKESPACDDASTAASDCVGSEVADTESLVDDLTTITAEDEWQPVVCKHSSKALEAPKMEQPRKTLQPCKSIFRPICTCCLLPGSHFADKCAGLQRAIGSAQQKQRKEQREQYQLDRKEQREQDQLDRQAAVERRRAHQAAERAHAVWEQDMLQKEKEQELELARLRQA